MPNSQIGISMRFTFPFRHITAHRYLIEIWNYQSLLILCNTFAAGLYSFENTTKSTIWVLENLVKRILKSNGTNKITLHYTNFFRWSEILFCRCIDRVPFILCLLRMKIPEVRSKGKSPWKQINLRPWMMEFRFLALPDELLSVFCGQRTIWRKMTLLRDFFCYPFDNKLCYFHHFLITFYRTIKDKSNLTWIFMNFGEETFEM